MKKVYTMIFMIIVGSLAYAAKGSYIKARIDGSRWIMADDSAMALYGSPVLFAGLYDDGHIEVEGWGIYITKRLRKTAAIRIKLEQSEVGWYEISPQSLNEAEVEIWLPFEVYNSINGYSSGWVTITEMKALSGVVGYIGGRFSFAISNDEDTIQVRNGRFRIPWQRVRTITTHPSIPERVIRE